MNTSWIESSQAAAWDAHYTPQNHTKKRDERSTTKSKAAANASNSYLKCLFLFCRIQNSNLKMSVMICKRGAKNKFSVWIFLIFSSFLRHIVVESRDVSSSVLNCLYVKWNSKNTQWMQDDDDPCSFTSWRWGRDRNSEFSHRKSTLSLRFDAKRRHRRCRRFTR